MSLGTSCRFIVSSFHRETYWCNKHGSQWPYTKYSWLCRLQFFIFYFRFAGRMARTMNHFIWSAHTHTIHTHNSHRKYQEWGKNWFFPFFHTFLPYIVISSHVTIEFEFIYSNEFNGCCARASTPTARQSNWNEVRMPWLTRCETNANFILFWSIRSRRLLTKYCQSKRKWQRDGNLRKYN